MMNKQTERQKLEILYANLVQERQSFITHWRDLSDYVQPRRARFLVTDNNKGDRRNHKIIDSTATLSARHLRSGMMSGVTSPARKWFKLTTQNQDLSEIYSVKAWLSKVEEIINSVFIRSNLYKELPSVYGDLGTFGTAAIVVEEDFETVMRFACQPIGSYMIANDSKLKVSVFFREFQMTVRQIIERFCTDEIGNVTFNNVSDAIRLAYENCQYDVKYTIRHCVMPNENYDQKKPLSEFKKYSSIYYEAGSASNKYGEDILLSKKGYDIFPVLAPRWEVTGEDVYGTSCPAMDAIGDIKALQAMQKRKSQAIDKMVNPAMTGPTSLRNQKVSILPGDITYVDTSSGQQGFRPSHEVNLRINELAMDINEHQKRIQRAFYEDLFLMLANDNRSGITAREIEERHEEKMLALGPVLEQLNQDLLDPLIDLAFEFGMRQGIFPQPPEEIHGAPLKIDYVSIMAQAQKTMGISGVERFVNFTGQMAQVDPEVLDNINKDKILSDYSVMLGVNNEYLKPPEEVQAIRQGRAQAAQQAQQAQAMQQMAGSAKQLSETKMGDDENALTALMGGGQ